jgi:uridine kinase
VVVNKLLSHPLFLLGLALRVSLILGFSPLAAYQWYIPFLEASVTDFSLDPWSKWLLHDGTAAAFPYGYVMWIAFLPATIAAKFIGFSLYYGYSVTLLAADLGLMAALLRLQPQRMRLLLFVYWLSPIMLLGSFVLALNDVIPALLLTLAMLYARGIKFQISGVFLAAAISAKFSMLVAVPFFVIYIWNNKALRTRFSDFVFGFGLAAICLGLPFLLSSGGLSMLTSNPEVAKIYYFQLSIGDGQSLLLVPFIYLAILYLTWRLKRLNFDLFFTMSGMAFLLIVLATPDSPGWFIWCLPFLFFYQAISRYLATVLVGIFSGLYVLSTLLGTALHLENGSVFRLMDYIPSGGLIGDEIESLLITGMVAVGLILAFGIWRETVSNNEYFRGSRKPFVIAVAGDSGAGKDTFSDLLQDLFGVHSVARLSGDDYHLWDRHKPMWQVLTHLNPMANNLERYSSDLLALANGRGIVSQHYDHNTGKMTKPQRIKSNDLIIASGLHALYLPILRDTSHLRIFLDIDEGLRRYFKLQRDVKERGQTIDRVMNSIEKRGPDSDRFIKPQAEYADLILSLQPIHQRFLERADGDQQLPLKLVLRTSKGFNEMSLHRVLVGICGLHVDLDVTMDGSEVSMTIEGEAMAADIELAATILCPRSLQFLDIEPGWRDGMNGIMQLIILSHFDQALTKRLL